MLLSKNCVSGVIAGSLLMLSTTVNDVHAASVVETGGQLFGIDHVSVGGVFYDVRFGDEYEFTVHAGWSFAEAATQALSDLFTPGGDFVGSIFDHTPAATYGCEAPSLCAIITQYDSIQNSHYFVNRNENLFQNDTVSWVTLNHIANNTQYTYAGWTLEAALTPVPIPGGAFLFGSSLLSLMLTRRILDRRRGLCS